MKYKLIALDVDGTLLNDDHVLTPRTRETVRKVAAAGATIVLCTGRGPINTLPILEELGLEGVAITHNGAATIRSSDRTVLHELSFTAEQIAPYVEYCRREPGLHFDLNTPFGIYVESELTPETAAMYEKYGLSPEKRDDLLHCGPYLKMSVFGAQDLIDRVHEEWREKLEGELVTTRSGDNFIDVLHPRVSKGEALRLLSADWEVPHDEILAMGNYYNDQEMIELAGLGIAMENAPEDLKASADYIAPANNDEGVHAALSRFCL